MRLRDLLVTLVFTGVLVASPLRAGELRSVTERTLDAPRADVWTLLTTKAGLQKWLSRDVTLDGTLKHPHRRERFREPSTITGCLSEGS